MNERLLRCFCIALSPMISNCSLEMEDTGEGELGHAFASPMAFEDRSQCGATWDVQHVELYDGSLGVTRAFVSSREPAVGLQPEPRCTGTLISRDLFLSAGHCGYQVGDVVRFNYQVDGATPTHPQRPGQDFNVVEVVEQQDDDVLDYAIVRLLGNPGDTYGWTPIAARDPEPGELLTLIHHPAPGPKKVATGPVVDYQSLLGENWFRHAVDTFAGSSGSGVLDRDGFVVGIHTNGGCSSNPVSGNSALRMSVLAQESATIQTL